MPESISVLVVDDSAFMRKMVTQILTGAGGISVVGQAHDGRDALLKAEKLRPDVITLDVEMPEMDGVTALREITTRFKIPVVMLSSVTQSGAATTMKCLELGAVDFVAKPSGSISLDIADVATELIAKVRAAVRSKHVAPIAAPKVQPLIGGSSRKSVIVIGSSTGGPRALQAVIPALPANLKVPIVIVQHMPPTFTKTLAERLNVASGLEVKEAEEGDRLTPGQVLVAPGGHHLEFDSQGKAYFNDGPPVHGVKPSVDVTLASLVRTFGHRMVGVLLTGMGSDGAAGLRAIHLAGGTTIAESESTCVVFGMPKAAIEMRAVDFTVPLGHVAMAIVEAVTESSATRAS
ncbi:MAG TPA: chemotaxis response regulator protein-glutamate methylesterase [Fimbriimonadaceae bacterium]|nr:chemotaxis response regulator protein-glutamate methylesterase [Fimbriimonadaceae bacterium]